MSDYDSPLSGSGGGQGQRVKGVSVVKPIVYGSISRHFGKKRESDGHTHEWTVYVKPFHNEDMSAYVRKVQFKLHESYANPNRKVMFLFVRSESNQRLCLTCERNAFELSMTHCYRIVSKPPYEVSETGWGEFEVQIKIHLADPQERPVTLYHVLKLFHTPGTTSTGSGAAAGEAVSGDGSTTTSAVVQGRKTVVSECYDEIVFQVRPNRD